MPSENRKGIIFTFAIIALVLTISFIFMFQTPFERTGLVYMGMSFFSFGIYAIFYFIPNIKKEDYLIGFHFSRKLFIGLLVGAGFLILSSIAPFFSLLIPSLSLAIDTNIRLFVIIFIAPFIEEVMRASFISLFMFTSDNYRFMPFWLINIFQAGIFSAIHVTAYGLLFNALDSAIQVWGGLLAISGALIAAFVWGLIGGYLTYKFNNWGPSTIGHMSINAWLSRTFLLYVG